MCHLPDDQELFWQRLHVRPWLLLVCGVVAGVLIGAVMSVRRAENVEVAEAQRAPAGFVFPQLASPAETTHGARRNELLPNPAVQKAGPADPRAEQRSANSAEAAARAAADLAAAAASSGN